LFGTTPASTRQHYENPTMRGKEKPLAARTKAKRRARVAD
jgi:ribosomal protein S21